MSETKKIYVSDSKTIKLDLCYDDSIAIFDMCRKYDVTLERLINKFLYDLAGGMFSGGDHERELLKHYVDFSYPEEELPFPHKSLYSWLLENYYDLDDFLDIVENIEEAEFALKDSKIHPEDYDEESLEYAKSDLEGWNRQLIRIKKKYMEFVISSDFVSHSWIQELPETLNCIRERLKFADM